MVIADDHRIILDALAALLSVHHFNVVGTAENGRRAVLLARQRRPDVVILDVTMPVMGGLDAARLILRTQPKTAVLFLTDHAEDHVVLEGLRLGVHGFVVKAQGLDDLIQAIRDVGAGAIYVSALYSRSVLQAFSEGGVVSGPRLSDRERQMLRLIAESKSTKEAAAAMAISVRTAECHRGNLMSKLGIHDTAGLVRYAIRQGVIVA
ncbi:MAG TPA: response regulator transcription factor [Gemmatimonadales bacterium]|nr:response regulator transcription factor [Gemmatimonadales bacterium]